ncbi:hypothetical protein B0E54_04526 [Micromonospora sp. MH99]|nr:hypothetical protein [Micromonospora sp. MH99]
MLKTWFARTAVAVLVAGSVILTQNAPALAQSREDQYLAGGTINGPTMISLATRVSLYDDHASLSTNVMFGANATSATGCKITGWLILQYWNSTSTWEGPRNTFTCEGALTKAGTGIGLWWDNWAGYTSADGAQGRVCVDLYYNGSTSSGWQRCYTAPVTWEG